MAAPDYLLIAADYCQLELRLLAHISEDSALLSLLNEPEARATANSGVRDAFKMVRAIFCWCNSPKRIEPLAFVSAAERSSVCRFSFSWLHTG